MQNVYLVIISRVKLVADTPAIYQMKANGITSISNAT